MRFGFDSLLNLVPSPILQNFSVICSMVDSCLFGNLTESSFCNLELFRQYSDLSAFLFYHELLDILLTCLKSYWKVVNWLPTNYLNSAELTIVDNYGIWLKDVKILNTFLFWLFRWFKSPNIHLLVYKKANNDYFACTCVMFCACLDVWSTFAPVILCIKLSILRIYSTLIVNSLVTKSDIVILLNLNMNVNSEYRPFPRLFEREKN